MVSAERSGKETKIEERDGIKYTGYCSCTPFELFLYFILYLPNQYFLVFKRPAYSERTVFR